MKKKITKIEEQVDELVNDKVRLEEEIRTVKENIPIEEIGNDIKDTLSNKSINDYYQNFCSKMNAEREDLFIPDSDIRNIDLTTDDNVKDYSLTDRVIIENNDENKKISFLDRILMAL